MNDIKQEVSSAPNSPANLGEDVLKENADDDAQVKQECDPNNGEKEASLPLNNNEESPEGVSTTEEKTEIKTETEPDEGTDIPNNVDVQETHTRESDVENCKDDNQKDTENETVNEEEPPKKSTFDMYKENYLSVNGHGMLRRKKRKKSEDACSAFGKFVAQELRLLQSSEYRLLLKRKIQRAVLEISELDEKYIKEFMQT
ncbi:uncharacterized protein [Periplaneta americana]|uniref:uncharacterized protein n=1 Tax=Periplaneta americana TaxID=6978 RepID=UPI0037E749D5